jgi:hypothetical protein
MPTRICMRLRPLLPAAVVLALAACATAGDLPLAARPELADSLAALHHDEVNNAVPLTVSEVALLAVQNDPDLRAGRAQLSLTGAAHDLSARAEAGTRAGK